MSTPHNRAEIGDFAKTYYRNLTGADIVIAD